MLLEKLASNKMEVAFERLLRSGKKDAAEYLASLAGYRKESIARNESHHFGDFVGAGGIHNESRPIEEIVRGFKRATRSARDSNKPYPVEPGFINTKPVKGWDETDKYTSETRSKRKLIPHPKFADPEQDVDIVHGGSYHWLKDLLSGKRKGNHLETGSTGIWVHPKQVFDVMELQPGRHEHYLKKGIRIGSGPAATLKGTIKAKYIQGVPNAYEGAILDKNLKHLRNVSLEKHYISDMGRSGGGANKAFEKFKTKNEPNGLARRGGFG